jgi:type IV pilus assembly protein PilB
MSDVTKAKMLASKYNVEYVDLSSYNVDRSVKNIVTEEFARKHGVVPIGKKFGVPIIAVTDPSDTYVMKELESQVKRDFITVITSDDHMAKCLSIVYPDGTIIGNGSEANATEDSDGGKPGLTDLDDPVASILADAIAETGTSIDATTPGTAHDIEGSDTTLLEESPPSEEPPLLDSGREAKRSKRHWRRGGTKHSTDEGGTTPGSEKSAPSGTVTAVAGEGLVKTNGPALQQDERTGNTGTDADKTRTPDSGRVEVVDIDTADAGSGASLDVALQNLVGKIIPASQGSGDNISSFPPLARILVESGHVKEEEMISVLAECDATDQAIANVLIQRRLVSDADITWATAKEMGLEFVNLDLMTIDMNIVSKIPEAIAKHHNVLLVGEQGGQYVVALSNPADVFAMDDLRSIIGSNLKLVVAPRLQISKHIERCYTHGGGAGAAIAAQQAAVDVKGVIEEAPRRELDIQSITEDAPVVRYVNILILQALNERASDIHIEPSHDSLRIRYRIDGVLHDMQPAPLSLHSAVSTRLKVMGDLNVAEHRIPQDGRISVSVGNRVIDMRIATIPTVYGEKVVLRILDKSEIVLDLEKLGCETSLLERFRAVFNRPYGTILVTGPTGSGKTTTLYATLAELNSSEKNIITVEDPVELRIAGINQVQTNAKAGLSFASSLRSIVRCDPDIVMVGEIRDKDTALIAIEAALTGHLLLATMHTNDASRTPMRLVEMGIEPYLVASALTAIMAQRLVRVLCVHCKEPYSPTEEEILAAGWKVDDVMTGAGDTILYRPTGCPACSNTGYRGREAVYELLVADDELEKLITSGSSADHIQQWAAANGMVTLRQAGLQKVLKGETTLKEVMRVAV